ncbi:MAG: DUF3644 domain-containing protein [Brachybacterium alimentarium]
MGAPYVSKRRLVDNSMSAMLSAIEIFNKPRISYRDEVTVVLVVNASSPDGYRSTNFIRLRG